MEASENAYVKTEAPCGVGREGSSCHLPARVAAVGQEGDPNRSPRLGRCLTRESDGELVAGLEILEEENALAN